MVPKCDPETGVQLSSPIGTIIVFACDDGLHSISIAVKDDDSFHPDMRVPVRMCTKNVENKHSLQMARWLEFYFRGDAENLRKNQPSICTEVLKEKGAFHDQVRVKLHRDVQFGQTITYGQLAALVGKATASRAVGTAMRTNPLSILVPCHRVLRAGGQLGNYNGGRTNSVKKWLLEHEEKMTTRK